MADGPDAASGHERSLSCARKPELSTRGATTTDLLNGYTDLYPSTVYTRGTPERYDNPRAASRRGAAAPAVSDRRGVRCALLFISSDRRVDRRRFSILQSVLYTPRATSGRAVCTRSGRCGCTPGTCPRDLSSYVVGTFTTSQPGTVLSRVSSALASAPTALASAMASSSKPSSSIMSLRSLASACPSSSCR